MAHGRRVWPRGAKRPLAHTQESSMTDRSVIEVYRAKNGAQAHLFVRALEEAGVLAEAQGDVFHPASATADSLASKAAPWWDAPRILVFAAPFERVPRR